MHVKKQNSISRSLIKQIALEYSNLSNSYAQGFFCKKYNLTPYYFRQLIEKSIIELIIDDDACMRIRKKALENSLAYGRKGQFENSKKKYENLFFKRYEYARNNQLSTSILQKLEKAQDEFQNKTSNLQTLVEKNLRELIAKYQYLVETYHGYHIEEEGAASYDDLCATLDYYKLELNEYLKHNQNF